MAQTPKDVWKTLTSEQRNSLITMAFGIVIVWCGLAMLMGWAGVVIGIGLMTIIAGAAIA